MRLHYVRDLCTENIVNVEYVQTTDMEADIMTKPLYGGKFKVLERSASSRYLKMKHKPKNNT